MFTMRLKPQSICHILVGILSLTIGACSTSGKPPLREPEAPGITVPKPHTEIIEKNSSGDSEFSGLYNTFELKATILNTPVRDALIQRQAEYYQWDQAQISAEREKSLQENSSESAIFVSFSTPERRNDNLADKKTIWRVFLDVGGKRYVGQAKKDRRLIAELQSLFPFHTRWNTPYIFTFPVAMNAIETDPIKLTVTGPLGSRVLEFSPVSHSGLTNSP